MAQAQQWTTVNIQEEYADTLPKREGFQEYTPDEQVFIEGVYAFVSDGTNLAAATGNDQLNFISSNGSTEITVAEHPAGDNVDIRVNPAILSDITALETLTAAHSDAIADLEAAPGSDVTKAYVDAGDAALQTQVNGKAATAHTHVIADTTGLQTALDGKAALSHAHIIGDVTGLQAALDGKATVTYVDTGLASKASTALFSSGANGLAPATAGATTTFLRADGTWAAPAGGGGTGDVVGPASAVADRIATYNGTTGKLIKDGGKLISELANASHTHAQADVTNLVSDLALKAPLASPTFTGDPKSVTPATADNDTSIATTAHVQANMALKANVSHTHAQADITNLVSDLALKAPIDSPVFTTTASLTVASGAASFNISGINNTNRYVRYLTAGSLRWAIGADNAAESTGNAGSNFELRAYDDSAALLGTVFTIPRATRIASFTISPTAPTPTTGDSTTKISTTAFVQASILADVNFLIDNGSSAITTGLKGAIELPFAGTITQVTLLADVSGSVGVDIQKCTYANYPTTASICASDKPLISGATKSQKTSFTGWTLTVAKGDILTFTIDSAATIKRLTIAVQIQKT